MANAVSQRFAAAVAHHQAGRLETAEGLYRQVLQVEPDHAEAINLLGVIAGQKGEHQAAADKIAQAIAINPAKADFHVNLAEAYRGLKRFPEAIACCRRALELAPDDAGACHSLGNALRDNGQVEAAVECFQRAVQLNADFAEAHFNLADVLQRLGKFKEAFASYQRTISLQPNVAETFHKVGDGLRRMGQFPSAIVCFRRAVELAPDRAAFHNCLGCALKDRGQLDEAISCFRRAIELEPECAEAHGNLGLALQDQGRFSEGIACYQRALQIRPDFVAVLNGLGCTFKEQGRLSEAIDCFRQALAADPASAFVRSNLLFASHYADEVTCEQLAEMHREYDEIHASPLATTWRPHHNSPDPERRLRLGFLSPDFHQHPVAIFLIRILENLDREACEIVCYSHHTLGDKITARFRDVSNTFHDVFGYSDEQLAEQIRDDGIDLLFDLAGHSGQNRLLVFARKPAPIQIAWIGYEGTTGLGAMDYLLADRYVVPEGMESYYREKVVRMPEGYVCYDPPAAAPPVSNLPAVDKGYVTFGSFNNLVKITPAVISLWSEILRRLPESRLILKYKGLIDESVQRQFLEAFRRQQVAVERLILLPSSSYADYMAAYQQVDIALDTRPFSGSATTCDALWMGVPVITWPGETFASRHTFSHLSNIGLFEAIAQSRDDYVERALALAADLPRLAALRSGLRDRVAASPLCDGQRFAANLMPLLRDLWRQWCDGTARQEGA